MDEKLEPLKIGNKNIEIYVYAILTRFENADKVQILCTHGKLSMVERIISQLTRLFGCREVSRNTIYYTCKTGKEISAYSIVLSKF